MKRPITICAMLYLLLLVNTAAMSVTWNTPLVSVPSRETSENINIGTGLPPLLKGDFTIDMWINPANTQQTYANILDFNHRTNIGMVFQQNGNDVNNYMFALGDGSSSSYILYRLTANVWQHIAFQREGGTLRLYCNGVLVSTASCFRGDIYYLPDSNVTVGYNLNYGRYFSGSIKGLKFWDYARADYDIISDSMLQATFNLNGTSDGIMMGNAIVPNLSTYFAVEMEINPADTQQAYANIIDFNHGVNIGMVFQQNGNDVNNYMFAFGNMSSSSYILYRLTANVWQKVKFERRGTTINLYINGKLAATQPCFSQDIYFRPNSNVTLGYNANCGRYFKGSIRNLQFSFILSSYSELTIADPGAIWLGNAPQTPVSTGNSFSTEVNVNCGELNLYAYTIRVKYDPNVLSIDPTIWPTTASGTHCIQDYPYDNLMIVNPDNPGELIFSGFDIGGKGPGVISLLPIKWVAIAPGTSEISYVITTFTNDITNYSTIGTPTGINSTITVQ